MKQLVIVSCTNLYFVSTSMDGLRRRGRSHSPYRSNPHSYRYLYDNSGTRLIVRQNSEVDLALKDRDMDELVLGYDNDNFIFTYAVVI